MRLWKMLGLAGVAGVAATGAVVARAERRRRAYEPEEVKARLLQRYQEGGGAGGPQGQGQAVGQGRPAGCLGAAWARARRAVPLLREAR